MARYEINTDVIPINFECTIASDIRERTIQNCKNLLMCRKGEIPYDRQRGLDPAIFDLPMDEAEDMLMPELDRVMLWEPDAEVVSGTIGLDENGETRITCVIELTFEND